MWLTELTQAQSSGIRFQHIPFLEESAIPKFCECQQAYIKKRWGKYGTTSNGALTTRPQQLAPRQLAP